MRTIESAEKDCRAAEAAHRELYVPAAEKYHGEFARTM